MKAILPAGGQRGQTVTLAVTGNVGTPPATVWCSRPDLKFEPAAEAGRYTVAIPAEAEPGVCWLRWHNAEGASALRAFVIGTLPEAVEKEPNNELSNAMPIESPRVVVNGVLDKNGEIDIFAVPLKKGETLVAAVDANRTLGSPMDGVLQIVSPRGFVLEQNDDSPGYDPLATHTAAEDGTYFVRLFAFPTEPNTNVALHGGPDYVYRLTLTTGPYVEQTQPASVTAGMPTTVKLLGWNIPPEAATVVLTAGSNAESVVLFRSDLANAISLPVVPHPSLAATAAVSPAAPMSVPVPVTLAGCVSRPKQRDAFAFAAKKGERLSVRVEARPLGSLLDPIVRVTDAAGKTLQEIDDSPKVSPDAEFVWASPADGEYRVEVRDLYEDGGPRYFYRLTIEPEQPDVSLAVAGDLFTLPADKPLEIPVTIERTGGHKDDLEIGIVGLPDGIVCAGVKSLATDATAKMVKLVVERKPAEGATPLPDGVPLRIVAKSAAATPIERIAEAPMAGRKLSRTRDLWLTILPTKP